MSEISKSIQFLCDQKGLDAEIVIEAVEAALGAAYRKDFGHKQMNIKTTFDIETGDMQMWDVKEVVADVSEEELEAAQEELALRREKAMEEGRELSEEEVDDLPRYNPKTEIMLAAAKEIKKDTVLGDILEIELDIPGEFGRMAAQTAKQVIIQKVREAERNNVFDDFQGQEGSVIQAVVHRRDKMGKVLVDLGKITGVLNADQQSPRDRYTPGARMRFYIMSVEMTQRGPDIILSRTHPDMVRAVFEQEIPEIASGEVEIKGIARDAGARSKVAVSTEDESIDPIGSCIGQRGSRITTIIEELDGEKVDIIQYSDDTYAYIKEALSPAKVDKVELEEDKKTANVYVVEDQFSLAIGRGGQNVRLAAQLTGWEINVLQLDDPDKVVSSEDAQDVVEEVLADKVVEEIPEEVVEVSSAEEENATEETPAEEMEEETPKA